MKISIGIFFGGQSREREVSFAGGRTVFDNLDKNLFEPVPIFVDSFGNFIKLDWAYIYKGTIRDFYPPIEYMYAQSQAHQKENQDKPRFQIYIESLGKIPSEELEKVISKVGSRITPSQFKDYIDFAFLALHGVYGEDGALQGILEWHNIPYSGSGILPSAIGINKVIQSKMLAAAGFHRPKSRVISRELWLNSSLEAQEQLLQDLEQELGWPLVVKSPQQGSSIGVSIVREKKREALAKAIEKSLFIQPILGAYWQSLKEEAKEQFMVKFTDIREGLGFPVAVGKSLHSVSQMIYHPEELLEFLDQELQDSNTELFLFAQNTETQVLVESFLEGKEFSCIVIQEESGKLIALPPTEIIKYQEVFDYRSKYLPGTSRKVTPIDIEDSIIETIRQECIRLFELLNCNVYARIDGFISKEGKVFLNDPNTTSGMLPSSFFFHQAAEIGLHASHFLTYIIRTSLAERIKGGKRHSELSQMLHQLDQAIQLKQSKISDKLKVAVIMGGYSTERHISMESGRNIYEKLASSTKYAPFPVFLTGSDEAYELYILPFNYMLKDNADDIRAKIKAEVNGQAISKGEAIVTQIMKESQAITQKYAGDPLRKPQKLSVADLADKTDLVFIALHGRPGEDGTLQKELEKYGVPYNGSGVSSSQTTINKFETNEILKKQGLKVADHRLLYKSAWQHDSATCISEIEQQFSYPFIAKPADDGCSSAVKKIKNRVQLEAFAHMMFREQPPFLTQEAKTLGLKPQEEFPQKHFFLIEELIEKGEARYFLEITGGLLTHWPKNGSEEINYEIFAPSETLALGDVLSLEEKFLAGEGQNITPAVYAPYIQENQEIAQKVKSELKKVAQILNIEGYARIDAFVRVYAEGEVEVIIIEINSLPGMTPATCIFHQAALNDYRPYQFIDAILNFAQAKHKN